MSDLLLHERQSLILRRLQSNGRVIAASLAQELSISEDTVRRDLHLSTPEDLAGGDGVAAALKKAVADFARQRGLRATEWKLFECSGTAAGQTTAFGLLVHGATLAVVGFTMDKVEIRLSNLMAFDARAIGNWGCPPELYPGALDLVLDGKVRLAPFVETHPLSDINRVFDAVHRREITRRAVMVP